MGAGPRRIPGGVSPGGATGMTVTLGIVSYLRVPLGLVRVEGHSMSPTLRHGDLLLIQRTRRRRAGALVVVRLPPRSDGTPRPIAVKRLAGPDPGDPARWWLERDNPAAGVDSWLIGSVADADVLAVVVCRVRPRPHRPRSRPAG